MIKIKQTKFGMPEGNCLAACIASILEIDLETVTINGGATNWYEQARNFVLDYGYDLLILEKLGNYWTKPQCYYIASGKSSRGILHAVVYQNGELVHDPHPDNSGLTEEPVDYLFFVARNPVFREFSE